jgi:hypothetical protein
MVKLSVGDRFPAVTLKDIDGAAVEFPAVFAQAPSTVIFFYRGRW